MSLESTLKRLGLLHLRDNPEELLKELNKIIEATEPTNDTKKTEGNLGSGKNVEKSLELKIKELNLPQGSKIVSVYIPD